jgi:hypothetical protein
VPIWRSHRVWCRRYGLTFCAGLALSLREPRVGTASMRCASPIYSAGRRASCRMRAIPPVITSPSVQVGAGPIVTTKRSTGRVAAASAFQIHAILKKRNPSSSRSWITRVLSGWGSSGPASTRGPSPATTRGDRVRQNSSRRPA